MIQDVVIGQQSVGGDGTIFIDGVDLKGGERCAATSRLEADALGDVAVQLGVDEVKTAVSKNITLTRQPPAPAASQPEPRSGRLPQSAR